VLRDLRAEYGAGHGIYGAASGAEALRMLRDLRLRGRSVALIVADQRMPGMSGLDLLREAVPLYPDAKRVLLTAYSDNEVAIRAINEIRLDHYLMKPWDPPQEGLYPVLSDLLDDWRAAQQHVTTGVRVIGHAWSAEGHRIRDFLARNLVPFRWLDVETEEEATRLLAAAGPRDVRLPFAVFPDGTQLERPSSLEIARKIGLHTRAEADVYDLVIVGAGPAGLAAAVYAASEGLRTLLIEGEAPGGQAGRSKRIENYLGFPAGLSGGDLARRAVAQARRFGAEILSPVDAVELHTRDGYHSLRLSDDSEVSARSVLIAAGVSYRLVEVLGAERLTGSGVYYGATISEAMAVQGHDVYVLGGGNSAGQAAMHLARYAGQVTILIRGASLASSMSRYLIDLVEAAPNVSVRPHAEVVDGSGTGRLERLVLADTRDGERTTVATAALFIMIGAAPRSDWLPPAIVRDEWGYVVTGTDVPAAAWSAGRPPRPLETSLPGVFAVGDVRHRSMKRVAASVGDGAGVIPQVHEHIAETAAAVSARGRPQ
jgi:thioredoxin reductase (NADPH)